MNEKYIVLFLFIIFLQKNVYSQLIQNCYISDSTGNDSNNGTINFPYKTLKNIELKNNCKNWYIDPTNTYSGMNNKNILIENKDNLEFITSTDVNTKIKVDLQDSGLFVIISNQFNLTIKNFELINGNSDLTTDLYCTNDNNIGGSFIRIYNSSYISLKRVDFIDGTTSKSGGAITLCGTNEYPSFFIIDQCNFIGNSADMNGGAIYSNNTNFNLDKINQQMNNNYYVNITETTFDENYSGLNGGAIFNQANTTLNIFYSFFSNNSAELDGGAIMNSNYFIKDFDVLEKVDNRIGIFDTVFIRNNANIGKGGAICSLHDTSITSDFTDDEYKPMQFIINKGNIFCGNMALQNVGGAIATSNKNLLATGGKFKDENNDTLIIKTLYNCNNATLNSESSDCLPNPNFNPYNSFESQGCNSSDVNNRCICSVMGQPECPISLDQWLSILNPTNIIQSRSVHKRAAPGLTCYLSTIGIDAGVCPIGSPCRTFGYGLFTAGCTTFILNPGTYLQGNGAGVNDCGHIINFSIDIECGGIPGDCILDFGLRSLGQSFCSPGFFLDMTDVVDDINIESVTFINYGEYNPTIYYDGGFITASSIDTMYDEFRVNSCYFGKSINIRHIGMFDFVPNMISNVFTSSSMLTNPSIKGGGCVLVDFGFGKPYSTMSNFFSSRIGLSSEFSYCSTGTVSQITRGGALDYVSGTLTITPTTADKPQQVSNLGAVYYNNMILGSNNPVYNSVNCNITLLNDNVPEYHGSALSIEFNIAGSTPFISPPSQITTGATYVSNTVNSGFGGAFSLRTLTGTLPMGTPLEFSHRDIYCQNKATNCNLGSEPIGAMIIEPTNEYALGNVIRGTGVGITQDSVMCNFGTGSLTYSDPGECVQPGDLCSISSCTDIDNNLLGSDCQQFAEPLSSCTSNYAFLVAGDVDFSGSEPTSCVNRNDLVDDLCCLLGQRLEGRRITHQLWVNRNDQTRQIFGVSHREIGLLSFNSVVVDYPKMISEGICFSYQYAGNINGNFTISNESTDLDSAIEMIQRSMLDNQFNTLIIIGKGTTGNFGNIPSLTSRVSTLRGMGINVQHINLVCDGGEDIATLNSVFGSKGTDWHVPDGFTSPSFLQTVDHAMRLGDFCGTEYPSNLTTIFPIVDELGNARTCFVSSASPSISPSMSASVTPSTTSSSTSTPSNTQTPSSTSTGTPTASSTSSLTSTPTISESNTPSVTPTSTSTISASPTPTITQGASASVTPTMTPTVSDSQTMSNSNTPSNTPSNSETGTPTQTPTGTGTMTGTPSNTETATPTQTPTQTSTGTPTVTPTPIGCTDDSYCNTGLQCRIGTCNTLSGLCEFNKEIDNTPCISQFSCIQNSSCMDGLCVGIFNDTICEDGNVCTTDICLENGCNNINNFAGCDDGINCTNFDQCNGFGVCQGTPFNSNCEDDNQCTDNTCSSTMDCLTTPLTGTPCDDNDACTNDICDFGTCISTPISPADNFTCTVDTCNPILGIINTPDDSLCTGPGEPCIEYFCDPTHPSADSVTGCYSAPAPQNTTCNDPFNCTVSDSCDGTGVCVGIPQDVLCPDTNQCVVGVCISSLGCQQFILDGSTCDDSLACTSNDTCSALGVCQGTQDNSFCDDSNECTLDLCLVDDDNGYISMRDVFGCLNEPVTNGTSCTDNDECTMGDTCQAGSCVPGPLDPRINTTCPTDDLGGWLPPCQLGTWECNSITGDVFCANATLPMAENCGDGIDNNCNGLIDELCDTVTCNTTSMMPQCNTTDQCLIGTCIGNTTIGVCQYTINVNATCSTGLPCVTNEVCQIDGSCSGEPVQCVSNNTCQSTFCNPILDSCDFFDVTGECDDGDLCTAMATCIGGMCVQQEQIDCEDNNICTINICDNGNCTTINVPDGSVPCSDGNPCTSNDNCVSGVCVGTDDVDCPLHNPPCVISECNILNGQCETTNTTLSCNDGDFCTENDTCNGSGECLGTSVNCLNNDICVTPICISSTGCEYFFNNAPCDNGNLCAVQTHCTEGECIDYGLIECDDDDEDFCRDTVCDPAEECIDIFNQNTCNDFIRCTNGDRCDAEGECIGNPDDSLCEDFNECTISFCNIDPQEGPLGCLQINIEDRFGNVPCDDGNVCTVGSYCENGGCQNGVPILCDLYSDDPCEECKCNPITGIFLQQKNCDDGDSLTFDQCNHTTGECENIPIIEPTPPITRNLNINIEGDTDDYPLWWMILTVIGVAIVLFLLFISLVYIFSAYSNNNNRLRRKKR